MYRERDNITMAMVVVVQTPSASNPAAITYSCTRTSIALSVCLGPQKSPDENCTGCFESPNARTHAIKCLHYSALQFVSRLSRAPMSICMACI